MAQSDIITIAKDDEGNIKYLVSAEAKPHEVIGALEIVSGIMKAQIIKDTLKETDNNIIEKS